MDRDPLDLTALRAGGGVMKRISVSYPADPDTHRPHDYLDKRVLDTMTALLARVNYKPGYTLRASYLPGIGVTVAVTYPAQDANHPPASIGLTYRKIVNTVFAAHADEERLIHWIVQLLRELEDHERHEWCRLDGKHVHEPHPERETPE